MDRVLLLTLVLISEGCCCAGLLGEPQDSVEPSRQLRELRRGFTTHLFHDGVVRGAPEQPPPELFELVTYAAPLGAQSAYVSPVQEGARRPAIVWISGGFDWGISANAWLPAPRENDQSARAFRDAGIVLMLPSLRGSNDNPGRNECFFGEVEDVIAAADFLAARPDVDPSRVYLGGHSTGATLALLVAATTDRFHGVFAFGPIDDPYDYGDASCIPEDAPDEERIVRAPIRFIDEIRTQTFLIEGAEVGRSNAPAVDALYAARGSAPVHRVLVPDMDHFSVLAPGTEVLAEILAASGELELDAAAIRNRL